MLKLSLLELFFRAIPEAFILVLASYAFSDRSIDKLKFCLSSVLLGMLTFIIRMLPIHFGVHTIILIGIYVLISVKINKLDVLKSISAVLISSIVLFFCEWINVFVLTYVFKYNIEIAFRNQFEKVLYGSPSLLLFSFIIILVFKKKYICKIPESVFNK